jgi:hypothetical protein
MIKRFIISEEERSDIRSKYGLINEQDNYENHTFIKGIQRFLNEKIRAGLKVDGLSDNNLKSETAKAIAKYQSKIGVYPTDGVWGKDTWAKMSPKDKQRCEDLVAEEGGIIDEFINWMGKMFN